jgi:hypothetical protein
MAKTKRKSKKMNKTRKGGARTILPSPIVPPTPPHSSRKSSKASVNDFINKQMPINDINKLIEYYMTPDKDHAITELKNIIPTFATENPYPNILCTIILVMSILSYRTYNHAYMYEQTGENKDKHKQPIIFVKGGLAVQIALKADSYVTNDADFAIFDKKIANSVANLICNCINKQLPSNLKLSFKDENRGDSSSVIKISLKPKDKPFIPMADISYIASDIDEKIYDETECFNHHQYALRYISGSFCSPSLDKLIMDKLYYIDFYTSTRPFESKVTKKAYDDKFKASLHRSINALLEALPVSDSDNGLEPKDRKINFVIDEYVNKFGVADLDNSLADRLRGFITNQGSV